MHRQGTYSNLCNDFVVLGWPGSKFDDFDTIRDRYQQLGLSHQPVNVQGVTSTLSWRHLIYDSKEKFHGLLKDLVTADLGLSVTVSGLLDQVTECCRAVGISPHTICQSMGLWGNTKRLPHFRVLEVTTMCGHSRISSNLVLDLAKQIQNRTLDSNQASVKMSKLCCDNIFNKARAAKLMEKLTTDLEAGVISIPESPVVTGITPGKDFGVTINETKCIDCMDCIPYCPMSAIGESTNQGKVSIDAERCTECGVCLDAEICPVEAIVAKDLTWPRTLRAKFHNLHAPYRAAPMLAQVSQPIRSPDEQRIFARHKVHSELTNDVSGFLGHGDAEVIVELGRPHLGVTFRDVQKVSQALIPVGLQLEHQYPAQDARNPLADLTTDTAKSIFRQDILDEKTGWVCLSLHVPENDVPRIFQNLRDVAIEIDTVFAVDVISRMAKNGTTVAERLASEIGAEPAGNCKTNVGLGRPLAKN